jgi:uncharacterized RDD family membrane protein YckC
MSNQYGGPWTNQPSESGGPGLQQGWAQPGPPGPPGPYAPVQPGFGAQPEYPPAPAGYGWQAPYPVGHAMPLRTDYASWGKRVGAMLIDQIPSYVGMIIFTVGYVYWLISIVQSSGSTVDLTGGAIPMMIGTLVMLAGMVWTIYNRWIVAGRTGQSLGKRVTKIRLIGEPSETPIGPMNAFLRDLVHILDGMAYVGYLWPLWDEKKQTFADKIMRTIVVNAG